MKKTLTILLAVVLMLALAIPAFAAEGEEESETTTNVVITESTGAGNQAVTATWDNATDNKDTIATVYLVTIDWSVKSNLNYFDGHTTYTWNAADTKYEATVSDKGWTGAATVDVTVTNKSNADITATATWAAAEGLTVGCTFDNESIDVVSAATGVEIKADAQGEAKTGAITASVATPTTGTIKENNATVGTITVSIAKKAAAVETEPSEEQEP